MSKELISKISLKGIGAQPAVGSMGTQDEQKPARALAVVFGRLHGYTLGNSSFGEYTKFKGSFEARNLETGKEYKAGAVLLPALVEQILREAVDAADTSIDFALEIGVKWASGERGYEYTVKPLMDVKESDELTSLRNLAYAGIEQTEVAQESSSASKSTGKPKGK